MNRTEDVVVRVRTRGPHAVTLALCLVCCVVVARLPVGAAQQRGKGELRSIEPPWILAGRATVMNLAGQDLAPTEIRFREPGIAAALRSRKERKGATDSERQQGNTLLEVEVTPAADLNPGSYPFELIEEGRETVRGRITVDVPAPEVPEKEPNHDLRRPQILPTGPVTVLGKLDGDGADVFQFAGHAGETWRCEVFARRIQSKLEPILRLRDAHLTRLRAAVDQGDDCAIELRLPADGTYLLELFDADNRSAPDFAYRLTLRRLSPAAEPRRTPPLRK